MKISVVSIAILSLFFLVSPSLADVFRCKGKENFAGKKLPVQFDIAIPMEPSEFLTISTSEGEFVKFVNFPLGFVSAGTIDVKHAYLLESRQFTFVVTRQPGTSTSLVGFYILHGFVKTIKIDTWKKNKPFIFLNSGLGELVTGKCE